MSLFFCTALVDAADTTWLPEYEREDLYVFSFNMTHSEGDFAVFKLEIENPFKGLLAPPAKTWLWVAINPGSGPVERFFGRLIGLSDDMFNSVITIQYIARSARFQLYRQAAADALRSGPYYDPLLIELSKRDDPKSVLEANGLTFHYDRVTSGSPPDLRVSTSAWLDGADGVVIFDEDTVLYDSVKPKIGQQPATRLKYKIDVSWVQRFAGTLGPFGTGDGFVGCWTGGSLIDDWPKIGTQLSAGYSVYSSYAYGGPEQYGSPLTTSSSWQNKEKEHADGDTMSISETTTTFPCGGETHLHGLFDQIGIVDPSGSLTLDGDEGINQPIIVRYNLTLVVAWSVNANITFEYVAIRPHKETVEFILDVDLQPILTDPNTPAALDTISESLSAADASAPIFPIFNWFSLAASGQTVEPGTIVKSTEEFIGPAQYSIAKNSGVVGATEPIWSDELGAEINDGTVVWISFGTGGPPSSFQTWKDVSHATVVAGTIIAANWYLPPPIDLVGIPLPAPAAGIGSFQLAIQTGVTQSYTNELSSGLAELHPEWPEPRFSSVAGTTLVDGSVTWLSLGDGVAGNGILDIPIALKTVGSDFFSTSRGQRCIGYALGHARARALLRARCIEVTFDVPLEAALDLNCDMEGLLLDPRLYGGQLLGKIKSYQWIGNGDTQTFLGRVTLAGAPGNDGSVTVVPGDPTYIEDGYIAEGYYERTGKTVLVSDDDSDVGYSPPLSSPDPDGISFPVTKEMVVVKNQFITGTPPGAASALGNHFQTVVKALTVYDNHAGSGGSRVTTVNKVSIPNGFTMVEIPTDQPSGTGSAGGQTVNVEKFFPITQWYFEAKPLQGISFSKQFMLKTTPLKVRKMIDLSATG